jgi:hypothetical protein
MAGVDHIEASGLQGCRDHGAVIDGVRKRRHVLIGGIAEHQRQALCGESRLAHHQQCGGEKNLAQFERFRQFHHDASENFGPMALRPAYQKLRPAPVGHRLPVRTLPINFFAFKVGQRQDMRRKRCAALYLPAIADWS